MHQTETPWALAILLTGGALAATLRGLADLIAAGGVIGGFLVGAYALATRRQYELAMRWAAVGGIAGGGFGAAAYALDLFIGG